MLQLKIYNFTEDKTAPPGSSLICKFNGAKLIMSICKQRADHSMNVDMDTQVTTELGVVNICEIIDFIEGKIGSVYQLKSFTKAGRSALQIGIQYMPYRIVTIDIGFSPISSKDTKHIGSIDLYSAHIRQFYIFLDECVRESFKSDNRRHYGIAKE